MGSSVIWMVSTGVDPSHMNHSFEAHKTRGAAVAAMNSLPLCYPVQHAQVARIEFDHPLKPASRVVIVASRSLEQESGRAALAA